MYKLLIILLLILISFLIIKKTTVNVKEGFGHVYQKDDFSRWAGFLFPLPKDIKTVNVLMKNDFLVEKISKEPPQPNTSKGQKMCYMTNCPPEIENNRQNSDQKIICWRCL